MRVWYDTEFLERGPKYPIELISIGMVREDGAELYCVLDDFDYAAAAMNSWLRENVLEKLGDVRRQPREEVRNTVKAFLHDATEQVCGSPLELWAWYGAYDHVVLAQLFGRMIDLPDWCPMLSYDLKHECDRLGNPPMPKQGDGAHNALEDARHLRKMADHLHTKHGGNC